MQSVQPPVTVYGVFGCPIEHSLSPLFQNEAFKITGLSGVYLPFLVRPEDLAGAVHAVRSLNMGGVNLTIPHKEAVIPYLDRIEGEAAETGSVNTIVNDGGKLIGYSTDGDGFLYSLRKEAGFEPQGKNVIVLGAGGAARAISFALIRGGIAGLTLVNRNLERALSLKEDLLAKTGFTADCMGFSEIELKRRAGVAELVINTTPVGMFPRVEEAPPFPLEFSPAGCLICDLIYRPPETLWLKKARELGLKVLGGTGMLLYQGILSFSLWTGVTPPEEPLRAVLEKALRPTEK